MPSEFKRGRARANRSTVASGRNPTRMVWLSFWLPPRFHRRRRHRLRRRLRRRRYVAASVTKTKYTSRVCVMRLTGRR